MSEEKTIEDVIYEAFDALSAARDALNPLGIDGTVWMPVGMNQGVTPGTAGALLYWYSTPLFNKIQRFFARYLFKTNPIAISGVENLTNMVGVGNFQYCSEKEEVQAELDEWVKRNKWQWRQREAFIKLVVDGEQFFRTFGNRGNCDLRFIDPELVYDDKNSGIIFSEDDYEDITGYKVNKETISAKEVQHRKLGWAEEKRGTSLLFSIAQHLINADKLVYSLSRTIIAQSKIAMFRVHEGNKDAVGGFRSDIQAQAPNRRIRDLIPLDEDAENIEHYPEGAVVDLPKGVKPEYPSSILDGDKAVAVLRAALRACAARFGIPESVLSQDQDSIAAYSGQLVPNSHCVKGLQEWQKRLVEEDKALLELSGFNIEEDEINIIVPECALHDKDEIINEATFLLTNQLASRETISKMFDLDYEEQQELIESEPEVELPQEETLNNGDGNANTDNL